MDKCASAHDRPISDNREPDHSNATGMPLAEDTGITRRDLLLTQPVPSGVPCRSDQTLPADRRLADYRSVTHRLPDGCSKLGSFLTGDDGLYYVSRRSAHLVFIRQHSMRVVMTGIDGGTLLLKVDGRFVLGNPPSNSYIMFEVRHGVATCPTSYMPSTDIRTLVGKLANFPARDYIQLKLAVPSGETVELNTPGSQNIPYHLLAARLDQGARYLMFRDHRIVRCHCDGIFPRCCRSSTLKEIQEHDHEGRTVA